jgi:hypothetical protein
VAAGQLTGTVSLKAVERYGVLAALDYMLRLVEHFRQMNE